MNSISVTIPTYNRLEMIKITIQPFLACKLVNEIVIVDDGGQDGTCEFFKQLAQTDNRIRYIRFEINQGLGAARKTALSNAKMNYVLVTDDDFFIEDGYLETLFDHMHSSESDLIGGRSIWPRVGEKLEDAFQRANKDTEPLLNYRWLDQNSLANTENDVETIISAYPLLVKREVFEKVTYYEGYRWNGWREDSDIELSALEMGFKLTYCPHVTAYNLPREKQGMGKNIISRNIKYLYYIYRNNTIFLNRHQEYIRKHAPTAIIANNVTLTSVLYTLRKMTWLARTELGKIYLSRKHDTFRWDA